MNQAEFSTGRYPRNAFEGFRSSRYSGPPLPCGYLFEPFRQHAQGPRSSVLVSPPHLIVGHVGVIGVPEHSLVTACLNRSRLSPCLRSLIQLLDRVEDLGDNLGRIAPHVAFPYANDRPTQFSQKMRHPSVTLTIAFDLCNPIRRIPTCRQLVFPRDPTTAVPKIAVAKDRNMMSHDHQVGTTRQRGRVQAISNASGPKSLSQKDLRSGILTTIAGPNPAGRGATRTKVLVPRHRAFSLLGWHTLHLD